MTAGPHPERGMLERFVLGRLSPPEMRETARHLLAGCPRCQEVTASLWEPAGVFPGLGHRYLGREGMRRFWADFKEPWERIEIEIEELRQIEQGSVLCRLRFRARGREGIEVEQPFTNHLLVRDGMLKHFQGYTDWDEALAELGFPQG